MRIVCISDLHGKIERVTLPEGDLLLIAGDMTNTGTIVEYAQFNHHLEKIAPRYKHGVLLIEGNHDWLGERQPDLARSILSNVTLLRHESATIDRVTFFGSPYTPEFCDWSFNVPRGAPIRAKWDQIPACDVLVTHGPPYSVLDDASAYNAGLGCHDLLAAVKRLKPRLHVFGHIHGGAGTKTIDGTIFVNAAICDEYYYPGNAPIVVDL